MSARARILSALGAAAVAFILLGALGIWQLERLAWKNALIARIDSRLAAAPAPLSAVTPGADADFTKVTVSGTFKPQASLFMIGTFEGSVGWEVITPMVLADGSEILTDRGAISPAARDEALKEAGTGPVTATGVLRRHGESRGAFSPDNDVKGNNWYWWDVPAMAAATGALPVVVQLLPGEAQTGLPRARPPAANLTNNHLQYAMTWFGLAVVLVAVTLLFIREQMKKSGA